MWIFSKLIGLEQSPSIGIYVLAPAGDDIWLGIDQNSKITQVSAFLSIVFICASPFGLGTVARHAIQDTFN